MAFFKRKSEKSSKASGSSEVIEFIPKAGACIVSRKVLEGEPVRWMTRVEPQAPADNGWQILSIADTPEYLNTKGNLVVADYNAVCMVEPALIGIWDFPIGTELMLHKDGSRIQIIDVQTNREIPADRFYVPPQHRA